MELRKKFIKETNKDFRADECCINPNGIYRNEYVEWLEEQLLLCGVVGRSEQLHKLLQHLSDEDELIHNRTHQQIIDDFNKLV